MLVIVVNQNNHNVLLWQPLCTAEIFPVEHIPWNGEVEFNNKQASRLSAQQYVNIYYTEYVDYMCSSQ